jgi:hypothetical protein
MASDIRNAAIGTRDEHDWRRGSRADGRSRCSETVLSYLAAKESFSVKSTTGA